MTDSQLTGLRRRAFKLLMDSRDPKGRGRKRRLQLAALASSQRDYLCALCCDYLEVESSEWGRHLDDACTLIDQMQSMIRKFQDLANKHPEGVLPEIAKLCFSISEPLRPYRQTLAARGPKGFIAKRTREQYRVSISVYLRDRLGSECASELTQLLRILAKLQCLAGLTTMSFDPELLRKRRTYLKQKHPEAFKNAEELSAEQQGGFNVLQSDKSRKSARTDL